jgi:quercetin dioxygenase-like cupin family protein
MYNAMAMCYKIVGWPVHFTALTCVIPRRRAMKIIQPSSVPAEPATSALFTGEVSRQPILTPEVSQNFKLGIVNFPAGVRNKMHTHSSDQVLFVTAGTGIIATETEEQEITVGDVVHIKADEKHWHGATAHSHFSHIALTAKGSTTTQFEP